MDAPESQDSQNAGRVRALLHAVLQKGGRRQLLLLGLFAVLVVTAGRDGSRASSLAPELATPRVEHAAARELPVASLPSQSPEAVALDNLLSRYDVLIRLLESRAIADPGDPAPALAELRTMRARLYEASRRAIQSTAPRGSPPDQDVPG